MVKFFESRTICFQFCYFSQHFNFPASTDLRSYFSLSLTHQRSTWPHKTMLLHSEFNDPATNRVAFTFWRLRVCAWTINDVCILVLRGSEREIQKIEHIFRLFAASSSMAIILAILLLLLFSALLLLVCACICMCVWFSACTVADVYWMDAFHVLSFCLCFSLLCFVSIENNDRHYEMVICKMFYICLNSSWHLLWYSSWKLDRRKYLHFINAFQAINSRKW